MAETIANLSKTGLKSATIYRNVYFKLSSQQNWIDISDGTFLSYCHLLCYIYGSYSGLYHVLSFDPIDDTELTVRYSPDFTDPLVNLFRSYYSTGSFSYQSNCYEDSSQAKSGQMFYENQQLKVQNIYSYFGTRFRGTQGQTWGGGVILTPIIITKDYISKLSVSVKDLTEQVEYPDNFWCTQPPIYMVGGYENQDFIGVNAFEYGNVSLAPLNIIFNISAGSYTYRNEKRFNEKFSNIRIYGKCDRFEIYGGQNYSLILSADFTNLKLYDMTVSIGDTLQANNLYVYSSNIGFQQCNTDYFRLQNSNLSIFGLNVKSLSSSTAQVYGGSFNISDSISCPLYVTGDNYSINISHYCQEELNCQYLSVDNCRQIQLYKIITTNNIDISNVRSIVIIDNLQCDNFTIKNSDRPNITIINMKSNILKFDNVNANIDSITDSNINNFYVDNYHLQNFIFYQNSVSNITINRMSCTSSFSLNNNNVGSNSAINLTSNIDINGLNTNNFEIQTNCFNKINVKSAQDYRTYVNCININSNKLNVIDFHNISNNDSLLISSNDINKINILDSENHNVTISNNVLDESGQLDFQRDNLYHVKVNNNIFINNFNLQSSNLQSLIIDSNSINQLYLKQTNITSDISINGNNSLSSIDFIDFNARNFQIINNVQNIDFTIKTNVRQNNNLQSLTIDNNSIKRLDLYNTSINQDINIKNNTNFQYANFIDFNARNFQINDNTGNTIFTINADKRQNNNLQSLTIDSNSINNLSIYHTSINQDISIKNNTNFQQIDFINSRSKFFEVKDNMDNKQSYSFIIESSTLQQLKIDNNNILYLKVTNTPIDQDININNNYIFSIKLNNANIKNIYFVNNLQTSSFVINNYNMDNIVVRNNSLSTLSLDTVNITSDISVNSNNSIRNIDFIDSNVRKFEVLNNTQSIDFNINTNNQQHNSLYCLTINNNGLQKLSVYNTNIEQNITINNNDSINSISFTNSKAKNFDVLDNTQSFINFNMQSNNLQSLSISNNGLQKLSINNTNIESDIIVNKNNSIDSIDFTNSKAKTLDVTNNTQSVNFNIQSTNLQQLNIDSNSLNKFSICNTDITNDIMVNNNKIFSIDFIDVNSSKMEIKNNVD